MTIPEPPRPKSLRKMKDRPEVPAIPASAPAGSLPGKLPQNPRSSTPSDLRTLGPRGIKVKDLNIAKNNYTVQILDEDGKWPALFPMIGTGKQVLGRKPHSRLESVKSLALRHVKFENTSRGLVVSPGNSLNGVYRRLRSPVVLVDGLRVRISDYILIFRKAEAPEPVEPVTIEGEYLLARDLWALGHLEFLRPDNYPGVRFPILNRAATIIGQGGRDNHGVEIHVDLPLIDDPKVSRRHAQITGRGRDDNDRLTLTDLNSRTGTWVQVRDPILARDGDEFSVGEIFLRVVETS